MIYVFTKDEHEEYLSWFDIEDRVFDDGTILHSNTSSIWYRKKSTAWTLCDIKDVPAEYRAKLLLIT